MLVEKMTIMEKRQCQIEGEGHDAKRMHEEWCMGRSSTLPSNQANEIAATTTSRTVVMVPKNPEFTDFQQTGLDEVNDTAEIERATEEEATAAEDNRTNNGSRERETKA